LTPVFPFIKAKPRFNEKLNTTKKTPFVTKPPAEMVAAPSPTSLADMVLFLAALAA
jgi:hypothetical protein